MSTLRSGLNRSLRHVLLAMVCVVTVGCAGDSESEAGGSTAPSSPDSAVLLALDYYNPIYKLDADGRVVNLLLDWRHVPDAVFVQVGKLTELDGLDLFAASFKEESLVHLEGLEKLRTIGMSATPITDKALVHLAKLQGLRHVWLPKSRLSPEAVEKLKKARPELNVYLQ